MCGIMGTKWNGKLRGQAMVTKLLKRAFDQASKLPEQEQDVFAAWILEELESEQLWDKAFARSEKELSQLADEALEEYRTGRTQELDPDKL